MALMPEGKELDHVATLDDATRVSREELDKCKSWMDQAAAQMSSSILTSLQAEVDVQLCPAQAQVRFPTFVTARSIGGASQCLIYSRGKCEHFQTFFTEGQQCASQAPFQGSLSHEGFWSGPASSLVREPSLMHTAGPGLHRGSTAVRLQVISGAQALLNGPGQKIEARPLDLYSCVYNVLTQICGVSIPEPVVKSLALKQQGNAAAIAGTAQPKAKTGLLFTLVTAA
eukprot:scaffold100356_cov15-Tisochrysis_lutea.AAC.1